MSVTKPAARSYSCKRRSVAGYGPGAVLRKESLPLTLGLCLVWLAAALASAFGCAAASGGAQNRGPDAATDVDRPLSGQGPISEETLAGPESDSPETNRGEEGSQKEKVCGSQQSGGPGSGAGLGASSGQRGTSGNGRTLETFYWQDQGVREGWSSGYACVAFEDVVGAQGPRHFRLDRPPRLVVDVPYPGRDASTSTLALHNGVFERLRIGRHPDKVRYVLEARGGGELPSVRVAARGRDVIVEAGEEATRQDPGSHTLDTKNTPYGVDPPAAPAEPVRVARAQWKGASVEMIDFKQEKDASKVVVSLDRTTPYDIREVAGTIVLSLPGATLTPQALLPIDTSAFASTSAVSRIEPSQAGSGPSGEARIAIKLREKVPYHVVQEEKALVVELPVPKPAAPAAAEQRPPAPPPPAPVPAPARPSAEAPPAAQQPPRPLPGRVIAEGEAQKALESMRKAPEAGPGPAAPEKVYTGRRISLDFKDADLQNVLRIIAEVSGKNIVISDAVKGKATIRLVETPWDMALDVILKTYALDKEELGPNILRVAPYTQLKKEREEARKADEALQQVEPLEMRIVPTNYAKGKDLEPLLQKFKSKRPEAGILVDSRTNSIIIKDLPEHVDTMERLIRELDTQTPEVLIEARIVELQVDYERQLGVQWGTMYRAGPATGNPTGLNFPATIGVGGTQSSITNPLGGISNPVVNLPASVGDTAGGALGISLGSLTNSLELDIVLSALEKKNHARVISSPRVVTVNNQEAKIVQGQEVPQMTVSANEGTKVEYKEAALKLSVTPQVTADKSIIMNILISNDTPTLGANNLYIINKKEATTSVLVKDGQTAVIGGIFTNNDTEAFGAVPWFHKIPLLGHLFKGTQKVKKRTELVIFITPRVLPPRTAG